MRKANNDLTLAARAYSTRSSIPVCAPFKTHTLAQRQDKFLMCLPAVDKHNSVLCWVYYYYAIGCYAKCRSLREFFTVHKYNIV